MPWPRRRNQQATDETSESERLLFGGRLRYDMGFSRYDDAYLHLSLWAMARRLPRLVGSTVRLAWAADRKALRTVAAAELGQGIGQAFSLVAVNDALAALLADGATADRLRGALPSLIVVGVVAVLGALLASASTAGTGRLEPKVERLATERYLECAARVELSAIEDAEFHRLLDSAQYGASSARRMVRYCVAVVNGLLAVVAAAGVLTVLHPVLLPLLVLIALPRSWSALRIARRRYLSFHTMIEHARAGHLLSRLLTEREAAQEVRVHGVGRFLLRHFRRMSESAEAEQTRLADAAARTELIAAGFTGAATLATYSALAGLLLTGGMKLSVAGTAVIAIRTGSQNLSTLVLQLNQLYEEMLFVQDLDRLCEDAERCAIPQGGLPLPKEPEEIRFESVSFTYPGSDRPALDKVSLTIPGGGVVALVGENGSGKSTLVKLLAGLHMPDSGRILWDGTDIAEADREQLFSRIAMVNQDFKRWPFTAKANVAIGSPETPIRAAALDRAAVYAGADDIVAGLPHGWDTLLAREFRGGHQLSGGQWQRLGIARARYRAAPVLLVDEPTSALDARAELAVFEQIRALAGEGQTVVLITHRLASVRHADLIHVLHEGRVTESGTPQELLDQGGIYAELFHLQACQYDLSGP
ncbi:ABC transporter ATP-binding protein [Streptomyces sp. NPDC097640]|uniref:ABC transporter ATP-binding protein n=1 Tax=Streptomyces sp. NPDC097640 TaxID=3157229 RepID=UPI003330C6EA